MGRIDFDAVSADALANASHLLHMWLPDGKLVGREYMATNPTRSDSHHGSFSINVHTGKWADFATGDKGGSLVRLCGYIFHLTPVKAAERVMEDLGKSRDSYEVDTPFERNLRRKLTPKKSPWKWFKGEKVEPTSFKHYKLGEPDIIYTYKTSNDLLIGYVCRWNFPKGKEVRPYNFFRHETTGEMKWIHRQIPVPRPLYNLPEIKRGLPLLLVEGEKACDSAKRLVGEHFGVLAWSGGCNAVNKMSWDSIRYHKKEIFFFPDADTCGIHASADLRLHVRKVRPIDPPEGVKKGWDLADAEEEGWTTLQTLKFIRENARPAGLFKEDLKGHQLQEAGAGLTMSREWKGKIIV